MTPQSIPALALANERLRPDDEALVDGDVRFTYADLAREMRRVAAGLMARGIGPDDRVALWAPNSVTWLSAFLGIAASGAAVIPINTRFKGDEAAHALRTGDAGAVILLREFLGTDYAAALRDAAPDLADLPIIAFDGGTRTDGVEALDDVLDGGAAVSDAEVDDRIATLTASDPLYVLFTSGTTGRPKGVVVTHHANLLVAQSVVDSWPLTAQDRIYIVLPFFHVFGISSFLGGFAAGGTSVLANVFEREAMLETLEQERITVLPGPPTIFQAVLEHWRREDLDLSALRVAFLAATSIPGGLMRQLKHDGPFEIVGTGYGLTEAGGIVALSRPDDPVEVTAGCVGQVPDWVEVKVVDDTGTALPPGETGEILVRSPTVMKEYYNDPEQTRAAFDDHGFLRTGDVGTVDAERYVRLTGRKKDMFIVGGFNAYPAEIEAILADCPDVGAVAVVEMPDDRMGEVGAAFVVAAPDAAPTPDGIIAWAREHMANYKVPRLVEIVDELPLNASMKVIKDPLRERARRAADGREAVNS